MKKFFKKISRWLPSKRKLIQLYAALLFNANFKGFVSGRLYQGGMKNICMPGLNCYSCPGAVNACPLGSLQGSFSADKSTLFYVGGILLLYAFLFGRMICGWLCPFGLVQELLHKIKTPKLKKSRVTKVLSYLKYVILVFFVVIVPLMYAFRDYPLPAFCKYICPAGTLGSGISLLASKAQGSYFPSLGPLFTWKFLLLVSFIVACVFIFRMFCRFVCPLGALYSLFNKISIFGIKVDKPKCTDCNLCVSKCEMDIRRPGDIECISCGECVDVCPTKAIVWKDPKIFLKDNEIQSVSADDNDTQKKNKLNPRMITRLISSILLIAVLVGSAAFYWFDGADNGVIDTATPDSATDDQADVEKGYDVGKLCYGADLTVITKDGETANTVNPVKTGKITVINFWGTWCGPCVAELPYFNQIATEYADKVTVIAIHSTMAQATAPAYIAKHYPESDMIFANDLASSGYYNLVGGMGGYPYTLILDENGIVKYKYDKSLHYEELKNSVDAILAE